MATIVTRAGKGSALTFTEADANFTNLNTDKAETASPTFTGTVVIPTPFTVGAVSVTATGTELNYLDIATLGTGAASKAVVLDSASDYTFPAAASITMPSGGDMTFASGSTLDVAGTLEIANVAVTSSAAELNVLDGIPGTLTATELGYVDGVTSAIQTQLNNLVTGPSGGYRRNRLINGDFSVAQRGTSFTAATLPLNSDDTYLLDRWTLLSDGNDIVDVTQNTAAAPGASGALGAINCIALDCETVNKKFGIIQIIEQKNCQGLIGTNAVLTFKAKVSSTTKFDNIKAAVIAWDGTADSVTSDIVSAWGIEGTDPTLVANWTYESTPANLSVTTSWATYEVAANINTASATNVAVFIWSDVTDTTLGDFIYITDVQLEAGTADTTFERIPYAENLLACQRYYYAITSTSVNHILGPGQSTATTGASCIISHPLPRIPYTGIELSPNDVTDISATNASGALVTATNCIWNITSSEITRILITTASGLVAGDFGYGWINTSGTRLGLTGAEL